MITVSDEAATLIRTLVEARNPPQRGWLSKPWMPKSTDALRSS